MALSMKLLIVETGPQTQRVVMAETTTDVVDYLRSLLASPDAPLEFDGATIDGCISNLYDSLETVAAATMSSFGPLAPPPPPPCATAEQAAPNKLFYTCSYGGLGAACAGYVTGARGVACPSCGGVMRAEVPRGSPGAGCSSAGVCTGGAASAQGSGSGSPGVPCALTDDLTVLPGCAASFMLQFSNLVAMATASRAAFTGCHVPPPLQLPLREKIVRVGYTEGWQILNAALRSRTVLTDVFVRRMKAPVTG